MPEQEARDDEHETQRVILQTLRTWRLAALDVQAAQIALSLEAAGYRKHPEPETTDEALLRFLLVYYPEGSENTALDDWPVVLVAQARTALEAALRVPVEEGEQ